MLDNNLYIFKKKDIIDYCSKTENCSKIMKTMEKLLK
jgi:hypothetical protein